MHQLIRRLLAGAVTAGAAASPQAFAATVIDFNSPDLTGLYLPGDDIAAGGYTLKVNFDFGTIDMAAALGPLAPSGNASQFYFNSNSGMLSLAHPGGTAFSLDGFSAAFVPLDPPAGGTTVLVAKGTTLGGTEVLRSWTFAGSSTSNFPFAAYAGAPSFGAFTNLAKVDFYACTLIGGVICSTPILNNGQFAIDDILVTAVPEPGAAWLLSAGLAGLLGLGLRQRRHHRHHRTARPAGATC